MQMFAATSLKQRQGITITAQLQQAIQLLQYNNMELAQFIEESVKHIVGHGARLVDSYSYFRRSVYLAPRMDVRVPLVDMLDAGLFCSAL